MCDSDDVQHLRGLLTEAERLRDQARRFATAPAVDLDRDIRDDSLVANQVQLGEQARAAFEAAPSLDQLLGFGRHAHTTGGAA